MCSWRNPSAAASGSPASSSSALATISGRPCGAGALRNLLRVYGDPAAILSASVPHLAEVVGAAAARAINVGAFLHHLKVGEDLIAQSLC